MFGDSPPDICYFRNNSAQVQMGDVGRRSINSFPPKKKGGDGLRRKMLGTPVKQPVKVEALHPPPHMRPVREPIKLNASCVPVIDSTQFSQAATTEYFLKISRIHLDHPSALP